MRQLSISILVFIITVFISGCSKSGQDPEAIGAELLKPFKSELQGALRDGISQGPVAAINVCRVQAPEIAKKYSGERIRMGRTSHRLRNPANAAPEWVAPVSDKYLADVSNRTPKVVAIDSTRVGYIEPIMVQPVCLTCHGSDLDPAVAARIKELYPQDQAAGFQTGDLRGVFWTEFPVNM
jgi:hypothetical protein